MDFLSKNIPTVARVKKQIRCKKIAIKNLRAKLETSYTNSTGTADRLQKEKLRLAESKLLLAKLKANRWRSTTIFEAGQIGLDLRRTFLRLFEAFGEPTTDVFIPTPHRGSFLNHTSLETIDFKIVKGGGDPTFILSHREPEDCLSRSKKESIAFIFGPEGILTLEEDGYFNDLFFRPPFGKDAAKVWNRPSEMSPEVFENLIEMFRRIIVAISYRNSPGYNFDFE